ncbi:hypothetical protein GQ57_03205 [Burkholderia sp. MSh2]|uniref:Putative lipoprotein n=1 Tax=Burkholderia paludis TaxID=1506587 RepID=A0A6J5DY76_9BURK|nr:MULTISPECIES: hypothetical protein [Burkholderia]KEZ07196.1 hypothetical protein GQ57_03205 [Burkholderia sp. MSh2]KFG98765.1 hypothetical protein GQ56_0102000 [Burkholderia paludis]CAB3758607.1 hypothetical protein LMG30113_03221 [Burkholderia paludis]VWB73294.1 putative lipoprotein [Burkholderia paludis]
MQRLIRAAACCALVSTLAACVVAPPPQPHPAQPRPNPQVVANERLQQIQGRIDNLHHRIDARVNAGYYPPPYGAQLHHRLDVIRQESNDMSAQHGGGLSGDEQRVLNQELDTAARAIGE